MESTSSLAKELTNLGDTQRFAQALAEAIDQPLTIAMNGTLGAGKTQFARYLCQALGVPPELVTSPTYVLLQRYRGNRFEIYHFDFYRLDNPQQVWDLGFDELQESPMILLVEWADKFPETLPHNRLDIRISIDQAGGDQSNRLIQLNAYGIATQQLLARLSALI